MIRLFTLTAVFLTLFITADFSLLYGDEDRFFSYDRFFLNQELIDKIPPDGRVQTDIKSFAVFFTDGLYYLSAGETDPAEKNLLRAREIWPEYFAADFLLALIYEEKGQSATAAQYYKSYLDKLRELQTGGYRISGPVIYSLSEYGVERYEQAYELVKQRLSAYGIDIDRVRPVFEIPVYFSALVLLVSLIIAYGLVRFKVLPYYKRLYRVKNPPEGFWVCRHCGMAVPELSKECYRCRRPR